MASIVSFAGTRPFKRARLSSPFSGNFEPGHTQRRLHILFLCSLIKGSIH